MKPKDPIYYLTYGDAPSGVYFSQVLDVCSYLVSEFSVRVRVIAFLSPRLYRAGRKKIKNRYPDAVVLPALPGMRRWKGNYLLLRMLFWFLPKGRIMARGPLATLLALRLREKGKTDSVIFDGRGAYAAEWNEYEVVPDESLKTNITDWEKRAVLQSDLRLAVSHQLVAYWQREYGYTGTRHVVVPCTLNSGFVPPDLTQEAIAQQRKKMGFDPMAILLVYAGSTAGWQSFSLLESLLEKWMQDNERVHLLFLARTPREQLPLYHQYPDRIHQTWVSHEAVPATLAVGDFGILIREASVTNQVASPTKFAEYLSSGLPVLISNGLGDYTETVQQQQLGWVIPESGALPLPDPLTLEKRLRLQQYALTHFQKNSYRAAYAQLLSP